MSDVCEMFGCTPEEARRQDIRDVLDISDYRTARAAARLWKQGAKGIPDLMKQPALAEMLVAMQRAIAETSGGDSGFTVETIYEAMRAMPLPDEEDEE